MCGGIAYATNSMYAFNHVSRVVRHIGVCGEVMINPFNDEARKMQLPFHSDPDEVGDV